MYLLQRWSSKISRENFVSTREISQRKRLDPGYKKQEAGYITAFTLQKQMGNNFNLNYTIQNSINQFMFKQEPTLSVQKKNLQNRINRAKNQNCTFGKANKPTKNQKACYFCGKDYSPNHKSSCAARGVICKSSNKKGHFASCCNSPKM